MVSVREYPQRMKKDMSVLKLVNLDTVKNFCNMAISEDPWYRSRSCLKEYVDSELEMPVINSELNGSELLCKLKKIRKN